MSDAESDKLARALLRGRDRATLATADRETGHPYASLVIVATDARGAPVLLLSTLALHTKNLLQDPHAALLFDGTEGLDEPLTGPRLTVMGALRRSDDPTHRARFLARHPSAAGYADFGDFGVFAMDVYRGHLVAGFGRIVPLAASALLGPDEPALAAREDDIVGHMNDDHADAVALYGEVLLGAGPGPWRMTGLDAEGCDLRAGGRVARLAFDRPVADAEAARAALVAMVRRAREMQAGIASGEGARGAA